MLNLKEVNAIDGFMEEDELLWLYSKARQMQSIVEIGCWKGRSTSALAQGCPGKVFTVDNFLGTPGERDSCHKEATERDISVDAEINLDKYENVTILKMDSLMAARVVKNADMVFIDGDHSYHGILTDLVVWTSKANKLLCGHDIGFEEVQKALAVFGIPYQFGPGSIWYTDIHNPAIELLRRVF